MAGKSQKSRAQTGSGALWELYADQERGSDQSECLAESILIIAALCSSTLKMPQTNYTQEKTELAKVEYGHPECIKLTRSHKTRTGHNVLASNRQVPEGYNAQLKGVFS